jgi:hypothetical protein
MCGTFPEHFGADILQSIFGTQFFNADFSDNGEGRLKLSGDFWLLWALALPTTAITVLTWYFWFKASSKRRLRSVKEERQALACDSVSSMA